MFIDDQLKREFYQEMTRIEHWDTRTLDEKIDAMLYERTALSRKPEVLIKLELEQIKSTNTQLPDKNLLSEKLQRAIAIAKEHFNN